MFNIFKGRDGYFYWHLRADNGEIIAQSEGYTSEQSARNGAEAVVRVVLKRYR